MVVYIIIYGFICAVKQEMHLILPDTIATYAELPGACYVKSWPKLTTDEMDVFTNGGCAATNYIVSNIGRYTIVIIFMVRNVTSSCTISCWTNSSKEVKNFSLGKYTKF